MSRRSHEEDQHGIRRGPGRDAPVANTREGDLIHGRIGDRIGMLGAALSTKDDEG
jgi:hypothetical protein